MVRLARLIDRADLSAIVNHGVKLDLTNTEKAQESARHLEKAINDSAVAVKAVADPGDEKWILQVARLHHGNAKLTFMNADFVASNDYTVLSNSADTFQNLIGPGATVRRGEGKNEAD